MAAGECCGEVAPKPGPREDQAAPHGMRAVVGAHTAACSGTGCPLLLPKMDRTLLISVISTEIILWLDVPNVIFYFLC